MHHFRITGATPSKSSQSSQLEKSLSSSPILPILEDNANVHTAWRNARIGRRSFVVRIAWGSGDRAETTVILGKMRRLGILSLVTIAAGLCVLAVGCTHGIGTRKARCAAGRTALG